MLILRCVSREGLCKKSHVLKLNTTGKFALNIVDNLVVVHHQSTQVSWVWVWVEMDVSLSVFNLCACVPDLFNLRYPPQRARLCPQHTPTCPSCPVHTPLPDTTDGYTDRQHLLLSFDSFSRGTFENIFKLSFLSFFHFLTSNKMYWHGK